MEKLGLAGERIMRWFAALLLALTVTLIEDAVSGESVDLELVIAVDISYSMDEFEQKLQRDGYVQALRDPAVLKAIRSGLNGRIALTYVEWAGSGTQNEIIPWTMIDGAESAHVIADRLANAPITRQRRTSISGMLRKSLTLFEQSPFSGLRRVIDVSGDGPNNDGPPVGPTRDLVIAKDIVINGLPLLIYRGERGSFDIAHLDWYYEDCVIGGPGSFSLPVVGIEAFAAAIRTKLILEITDGRRATKPAAHRIAASPPRVSCTIGEEMMRRFYGP